MSQANKRLDSSTPVRWNSDLNLGSIAGIWLLFLLALPFLEGETISMETTIGGGLIGALLVITGFMAASRVRPALDRSLPMQARFILFAVVTGVAVGVFHMGSNLILASLDDNVHALLVERFVGRPEWGSTFAAAVVEEVAFRLFVLSVVAWLTFRFIGQHRAAFLVGLLVSAVLFAVPHLWGRPSAGAGVVAEVYGGMILFNSGLIGCVLGWVFWRWGLLQAMVCHFVVNTVVLLVGPLFLC